MNYVINIEGFEGQDIEARVSFWTLPKLLINGERAPKGEKRGEMLLRRNDGQEVIAFWKPQLLGYDVPQLVVDGKVILLAKPLKWYQWIWSVLPVLLIFYGGLLGFISGIIGFTINIRVFRSQMNEALKYVVTGLISIMAGVVYLVVATIVYYLING